MSLGWTWWAAVFFGAIGQCLPKVVQGVVWGLRGWVSEVGRLASGGLGLA